MNFWLRHLGPNEWVLPQFLYLIIPARGGQETDLTSHQESLELNSEDRPGEKLVDNKGRDFFPGGNRT